MNGTAVENYRRMIESEHPCILFVCEHARDVRVLWDFFRLNLQQDKFPHKAYFETWSFSINEPGRNARMVVVGSASWGMESFYGRRFNQIYGAGVCLRKHEKKLRELLKPVRF